MAYGLKELQERSDRLAKLEGDARIDLLEAIGKKITEMAQAMNASVLDFTDKDDKAFDRTMKTMVEAKTISDNYKYLRLEIGINKETTDQGRVKNPVEAGAKSQKHNRSGASVFEDRSGEGAGTGKGNEKVKSATNRGRKAGSVKAGRVTSAEIGDEVGGSGDDPF